MQCFSYRLGKWLCLAQLTVMAGWSVPFANAGGPMGVDGGVVVSGSGTINLTPTVASNYVAGKTGWLRVNMILTSGQTSWNSTELGYYDTAINNARAAGLQVLILMNNQGWTGGQSSWNANNFETTGGNGDNAYVDGWVNGVALPIMQHFHNRVKVYEIWNEPSTWSNSSTNAGVVSYSGSSYMYPSCYSWLLSKAWLAAHVTLGYSDVKVISGGVFGTSALGASDPGGNSGSNYIAAFYCAGTNVATGAPFYAAKNSYGTYPVDGIGQHLYIDYNITTTIADVMQYLGYVRAAYTNFEGANTSKGTYVTEFGWTTASVSQSVQANNLATAFDVFEGSSYVPMAIWFNWQDSASANLYFGVFDQNDKPKIAYTNYQFYEEYEGYYIDGTIDTNLQNYFNARGQAVMGDAFDNGLTAFVHGESGGGYSAAVQDFAGGSHTNLSIFDSAYGTFEVNDLHGFWTYYNAGGGMAIFGPPQGGEYAAGNGTRQDFADGTLIWNSASGVVTNLIPNPMRPSAGTEPAYILAANTVTLSGLAVPNGTNTSAWFAWGTNGNYGQQTPGTNVGSGYQVVPIGGTITGLTAGLVYHYRTVASNALGVSFGNDMLFTTGGWVKTWGDNTYGQTNAPPGLTNAVLIASGAYHELARQNNGVVTGWGLNTVGQATPPAGLTNVVALAAGFQHSLALKADGTVAVWGGSNFGQAAVPAGLASVMAIAAGAYHNLVLKSDGTVVSWGYNNDGQTNVPAGLANALGLAAGLYHSVVLKAGGTVLVWGDNTYGQTNVPLNLTNAMAVSAGQYHTLALKIDGTVVAWGRNNLGQTNVPPGMTNVLAIACGDNYNLALKTDGTVVAWGDNGYGQTNPPSGLGNVAQLAGGFNSGLLIGNQLPQADGLTATGYVNHDLVIALNGIAGDGPSLKYRITTLPAAGGLYQYAAGARGGMIAMPNTTVSDGGGQVIFAAVTNQIGVPYDNFFYVANDGLNDSTPAQVMVNLILPGAPRLAGITGNASMPAGGSFTLNFGGSSNATYSIWASTNLSTWLQIGIATEASAGLYQFTDEMATNWIQRFYRAQAP
jgi:hypothetical protein